MLLTVDMGNTNITLGVFEGEELTYCTRLCTIREKTFEQYAVEIGQAFDFEKIDRTAFSGSIISSVVPELTSVLCNAIKKVTGTEALVVCPGIKTGVNILIDNPSQLGADLLAGAVGAASRYSLPCLVVDLGTASKISVIGKDGSYRGGMIAPGMGVSLGALSSSASLLPVIPLTAPKKAIGKNTIDCMQSGIIFGTASMVDGMIERFRQELGTELTVVATGGYSNVCIDYCRERIIHDDNLLLYGLREIYLKNS